MSEAWILRRLVRPGDHVQRVLTPAEVMRSDAVSRARQIEDDSLGRRAAHGATNGYRGGLELHLAGGRGQGLFASYMGVEHVKGDINDPHVAGYGVRSTYHRRGRLIVQADDVRPLVLVVLDERSEKTRVSGAIIGYMDPEHARSNANWYPGPRADRPAWFVPQSALWPISDLLHPSVDVQSFTADLVDELR